MKEFFRKRLVSLKRKPHMIPLAVLGIAFVYYSLNLTQVSNTTALINGQHMGLTEFATMLFSVLSLVCFMNAFPHRKKVNIPMLALMFLMVGGMIFCDIYYGGRITVAVTREVNRISASPGLRTAAEEDQYQRPCGRQRGHGRDRHLPGIIWRTGKRQRGERRTRRYRFPTESR